MGKGTERTSSRYATAMKVLSILLAAVMLLSPITVFAQSGEELTVAESEVLHNETDETSVYTGRGHCAKRRKYKAFSDE